MKTLNLRIDMILKEKKITHAMFAKTVGVSRSYITSVVNEGKKPSIEILMGIACHYRDINEHWLLTGEGPMYRQAFPPSQENELEVIMGWLEEWWEQANEEERAWLKVQLGRCFPEFKEWLDRQK